MGLVLFDRKASGIELTGAGAAMLDQVAVVIEDLEALAARARQTRAAASETVTFAYASASLPSEGGPLSLADLERFRIAHPHVSLNVFELTSDACVEAVASHQAHLAFAVTSSAPADVESACISRGSFLVGVSRKHPLANREALSFADLEDVPIFAPPDLNLTYSRITGAAAPTDSSPVSPRCRSAWTTHEFVKENRGVSFTPRFFAEDERYSEGLNAVFLPLAAKDDFSLPLYLVWRKGVAADASAELRDFILKRFRSLAWTGRTAPDALGALRCDTSPPPHHRRRRPKKRGPPAKGGGDWFRCFSSL
ncbi:MAG: LysR family transcriptional regulator [Eggerthellaceae bacterium]